MKFSKIPWNFNFEELALWKFYVYNFWALFLIHENQISVKNII